MSNDLIAKKYLEKYLKKHAPVQRPAEPIGVPVQNIADEVATPNVIVFRADRKFFAGVKRDGTVIWSHDPKFAKQVSEEHIERYEAKLGVDMLFAMWPQAGGVR